MFQHSIHNERCLLGSQTVNDQSGAFEAVIQFAERRLHEVLANAASVGEENRRKEVEQLVGQATRHVNEQVVEFNNAREACTREALRNHLR